MEGAVESTALGVSIGCARHPRRVVEEEVAVAVRPVGQLGRRTRSRQTQGGPKAADVLGWVGDTASSFVRIQLDPRSCTLSLGLLGSALGCDWCAHVSQQIAAKIILNFQAHFLIFAVMPSR